jgi:hypothetical protein
MKAFHRFAALITILLIPTVVFAQSDLKPCGTISRSTTLQGDCAAPLIVGADNIKINLNGFAVKYGRVCDIMRHPAVIELKDRRGVAIENGRVEGFCSAGLLLLGGASNHIQNMSFSPGAWIDEFGSSLRAAVSFYQTKKNLVRNIRITGERVWGVAIAHSDENMVTRIETEDMPLGLPVAIYLGNYNRVTRSRLAVSRFGMWVAGKGNVIERNDIRCDLNDPGVGLRIYDDSRGTAIKSNSFTQCAIGISSEGTGSVIKGNNILDAIRLGIDVSAGSLGNRIISNSVVNSGTVDMFDRNVNCGTNVWQRNIFSTDNEGDGPSAGCIR